MENNIDKFDFNDFLGFIVQGSVHFYMNIKSIDFAHIDFNKKMNNMVVKVSDFFKHSDTYFKRWYNVSFNYFKRLTLLELFGWIALVISFVMIILAIVLW